MTLYELTGDFIKLLDTKKEIDDDKALEKKQRFSDMEKQLQSFAEKQEIFDVDILKQSIKEYISELNKILFRARNAYA